MPNVIGDMLKGTATIIKNKVGVFSKIGIGTLGGQLVIKKRLDNAS